MMDQLLLPVDTIQPDEAYLIHRIIHEEFDAWHERDNDEYFGFGESTFYRGQATHSKLEGVVTTEKSYLAILGRFEKYAKLLSDKIMADNVLSKKYKNYEVVVHYEASKIKHIQIK